VQSATIYNHFIFIEILTGSPRLGNAIVRGERGIARGGGIVMHYEDSSAKKTQLMALIMTVAVVGGAIFYAMA
jgi:hypothetical protein